MSEKKYSWSAGPGEVYDSRGIPIYPGDLCRQEHFTEHSGKKHWLYHVAVLVDGCLTMVPAQNLEPTKCGQGGTYWLRASEPHQGELKIISGYGPGRILDYLDRKRVKRSPEVSTVAGGADAPTEPGQTTKGSQP